MKKSPLARRFLILFLTAFAARSALAASATWNGADFDWSLSSNWIGSPAVVPGTGDTATFGATGDVTPTAFGIGLLNLNFNATAQAYSLAGSINFDAGGAVSVAGGSAAQTVSAALTFSGNGTITNNAAAANVLALSSGVTVPVAAGSTLTFDGSGATTVTTINNGAGSGTVFTKIIKNGPGSAALLNSNTGLAGTVNGDGVTINQGTLRIANANAAGNRVINLNGGTLECSLNNANAQYTRLHVSANSSLFYSNTANQWQIGNSSTGVMVSTGTPVLTLDGTVLAAGTGATALRLNLNTTGFTGTWALSNKVIVRLANVNTAGAGLTLDMGTGTGTHIVESLATFHDTAAGLIKPITIGALTGTATDAILRGRQNTGTQTTGTQYRIGISGTDTSYDGLISDGTATNGIADGTGAVQTNGASGPQGTTEIVKEGAGLLTLTNTLNTYTGGTVLSGGTLAIAGDGSLGAAWDGSLRQFSLTPGTTTFTAMPVATMSGGGGSGAVISLFSSTGANPPPNNTIYLTFGATATNNAATGTGYTSNPSVTVTGTGNTATASVRVKGLLTFDGGVLRTDAALTSSRAVVVTANNGYLDTNGFDCTLSGVLTGPGSLQHQGAGTLILSGTGSTAGINLAGGSSVCLTGSTSGNILVNTGATLSGTGSTSGTVTVDAAISSSGILSPGCSVGSLGTGALTLNPMARYRCEIADWSGAAGTGYDTVNATSLNVTNASSTYPIAIHLSELALANFDGTSKTLTLVATSGGITGFAADKFIIDSTGFTSGAGPWSIAVSGNNLVLNYTGSASAYDTWASGHGLAGADALKPADPDKDGLTNIAEFGFNSSPNAGTAPGGPNAGGVKAVTGGDALTLTIRVRTGAIFTGATALTATKDGVKYTIQGSTDLAAWTADIDEVTPAFSPGPPAPDAGWEYRTFRFAATTATAGRALIRAVAEQP